MQYDRSGKPIPFEEFYELQADDDYTFVAVHSSIVAGEDVTVKTIWTGQDFFASATNREPMIFETSITGGVFDGITIRYKSESNAIAGHEHARAKALLGKMTDPEMFEGLDMLRKTIRHNKRMMKQMLEEQKHFSNRLEWLQLVYYANAAEQDGDGGRIPKFHLEEPENENEGDDEDYGH